MEDAIKVLLPKKTLWYLVYLQHQQCPVPDSFMLLTTQCLTKPIQFDFIHTHHAKTCSSINFRIVMPFLLPSHKLRQRSIRIPQKVQRPWMQMISFLISVYAMVLDAPNNHPSPACIRPSSESSRETGDRWNPWVTLLSWNLLYYSISSGIECCTTIRHYPLFTTNNSFFLQWLITLDVIWCINVKKKEPNQKRWKQKYKYSINSVCRVLWENEIVPIDRARKVSDHVAANVMDGVYEKGGIVYGSVRDIHYRYSVREGVRKSIVLWLWSVQADERTIAVEVASCWSY